ncbi:TPA: hypothetical protein ACS7W8_001485 [Providencia alcalifaciens]|uniref:hypothetical protein n=1 Tax=Providencia sp. PROV209 TaxID=2949906 RepID=UPI00234ABCA7|nr:hypothetical protein [Providencia sp. PROV209]
MELDDYIEYAKKIIVNDKSEVAIRTSISRAYYSSYYYANELISNEFKGSEQWNSMPFGEHKKLVKSLIDYQGCNENVPRKLAASVGNKLNILKSKRHDSDYNLEMKHPELKASQVIDESTRLINLVKSLDDE